jgi:hypothetical protein
MDFTSVINIVKLGADSAIDSIVGHGIETAQTKLDTLDKREQKTFMLSLCFDIAFIAMALCFIMFRLPHGIFVLYGIAAAKFVWTALRMVRLLKDLYPHKRLIIRFAPSALRFFCRTRSLKKSVDNTIRDVFRYFYSEKLKDLGESIHTIASMFGAVSSKEEIENKVVDNFCPLLTRYLRRMFFVNVLCFIVFYGIIIVSIKLYLMARF